MRELPAFAKVEKKYRDQGVVFIGIGGFNEDEAKMRPVMNKTGVDYRNALDGPKIAGAYGNFRTIPTTVFIGRDGMISNQVSGGMSESDLEREIKKLL